jgi:hypothetical protein
MDKFQESFCAIGCLCSGLLLLIVAFSGQTVVFQDILFRSPELYALAAICLGIQTHCYDAQKWIITKIVKAL